MKSLKERTQWAINYLSKNRRLSHQEIAKLVGVNKDTVGNYRNMATEPKFKFLLKFSDTFGFNLEWFGRGTGEPFTGAREKYPKACGPEKPRPARLRLVDRVSEESDLYGRTRHHEVDGEQFNVVSFEPDQGETDPFIKAVSGLKEIFDAGDPKTRAAIMANINAFQFSTILFNNYRQIESRLIKIERIINEHQPPNDMKERRRSWLDLKKVIGLE